MHQLLHPSVHTPNTCLYERGSVPEQNSAGVKLLVPQTEDELSQQTSSTIHSCENVMGAQPRNWHIRCVHRFVKEEKLDKSEYLSCVHLLLCCFTSSVLSNF